MTQNKKSILAKLVIVLAGAFVILGLWFFQPKPVKRPVEPPMPTVVDVISAKLISYRALVSTQGTIVPQRKIKLMAEVSGRVVKVDDQFVSGGFFNANDTLIQLDDRDYRFALANAESQVANAERELALEKGQARQAKRVWRDLGSNEANSLSLREPQVKAATAGLKAAIAERQRSKLNIERTSIKVPFDGRVESTSVELGEFVSAGLVLGEVFDSDLVEVRLPLDNKQFDLLGLTPGSASENLKAIDVVLSAKIGEKHYEWKANLSRVEAVIDNRTRLFHVIVNVAKPFDAEVHKQPLVVGLFVNAAMTGNTIDGVIAIPKKAINDKAVFVVENDNSLVLRDVVEVDHGDGIVWVKSNIREGEKIVISDPRILKEGLNVTTKIIKNTEDLSGHFQ